MMPPPAYPLSPVRILLAEDDPDHQIILRRLLARGRSHVQVDCVASGGELDQAVRAVTYDCIVLDYNLPDRTADEAMNASRYFLGQTPVVVVSSSDDQDVVKRSARAGGVDFINKIDAMQANELWDRVSDAINESVAKLDRKIAARLRLEAKDRRSESAGVDLRGADGPVVGAEPPEGGDA